jgi:hypothetical protein
MGNMTRFKCFLLLRGITQESFYGSYRARDIALVDHGRHGWDELERVAGTLIRPLFDRFEGFVHLFSEVD